MINTLKLIYLNTTFYFLFFLFSAIAIPLFTLLVAVQSLFLTHRQTMKRFRRAISWYGIIIIRVLPFPLIRVRYKDYENKTIEPCLFVCNHRSASDPFLMACLPYELVQIVNVWPFRIFVLGKFARWAGYLNINDITFEDFSHKAMKLLADGVSIITFPEGTRSAGKKMGQFHGSIFRLALATKYPIIPICISGNEDIPHKGSLALQPGTIKVHKLPALHWEKYKALSAFKLKNTIRDIITKELAAMNGDV